MKTLTFGFVALSFLSGNFLFGNFAFAATAFHIPPPQVETLPNGLQLVWFLSDKLPVTDLVLMVKSGYRDDPASKSGTAELLSSSIERGASGQSALELAHAIEMLGGSRYVSADEDSITIGMHGLALDSTAFLENLAKIALHPDFPEGEVVREHSRIIDRWNHLGDYGDTLASLAYQRLMTAGSVYGRGSFTGINEFKNVKREDVLSFYKTHFTPKNSILMIVGRVDQPKFKQKIEELFGGWKGEAPSKKSEKYSDSRLKAKPGQIVVVDRPNLTQAQVRLGFAAPTIKSPDHYPLMVANAFLGEYFNSRLTSIIRDKLGLTYSIGSSYSYSKDFAKFTVSSATQNSSVGQLISKTDEILKDMKLGSVIEQEVSEAKEYLQGGFPLSVSTLASMAARWLNGWFFDMGPEYLNEFVPKVSGVTKDQVVSAVSKTFDLDHMFIVVAGDAKEIEKGLSKPQQKLVKRVVLKDLL